MSRPSRFVARVRLLSSLCLGAIASATGQAPIAPETVGPAPPAEVSDWIRRHAMPLRSLDNGVDSSDLEPIRQIVADARIVALGEATHGTREFVQFCHRLVEFLVSNMGFSVFVVETPPGANVPVVNEYVLQGRGDAASALAALRPPKSESKEMLDLIEWMRRYNQDTKHARKIKFLGLDLTPIAAARKGVIDYLRRVDPEYAGQAEVILRETTVIANSVPATVVTRVTSLINRLHEHQAAYGSRAGKQAWAVAKQHAKVILQMVQNDDRDCNWSDNVQWILDQEGPEAKIIIYAHNGHIAGGDGPIGRKTKCAPMGELLRQVFGGRMLIIGTAFSDGLVRSGDDSLGGGRQARDFQVPPAPEGTLSAALAAAGLSPFLLDMRAAPKTGPVGNWFGANIPEYFMAALVEDPRTPASIVQFRASLRKRYDILLFVWRSSAPRPARRLSLAPVAAGSVPQNLDFERRSTGPVPLGWSDSQRSRESGYRVELSDDHANGGTRCAVLLAPAEPPTRGFGTLQQSFDAGPYKNKLVRFRASVRADERGFGHTYLYMRVDRPHTTGFYGNTQKSPVTSKDWRQFEIVGRVADDAFSVHIGLILEGGGRAWIDSVSFDTMDE